MNDCHAMMLRKLKYYESGLQFDMLGVILLARK
jgi:hypothetical protein